MWMRWTEQSNKDIKIMKLENKWIWTEKAIVKVLWVQWMCEEKNTERIIKAAVFEVCFRREQHSQPDKQWLRFERVIYCRGKKNTMTSYTHFYTLYLSNNTLERKGTDKPIRDCSCSAANNNQWHWSWSSTGMNLASSWPCKRQTPK